ncbi:dihydrofolate reductase [Saccharomycopsis crataegensis]|uniref:Dihydrofolate reductase n=1 Tax=Saccharomycopsis crataegensis TaxID=43959 RepID=A0AAV5QPR0_9ASCO|nr:dihydrofolate reductase [Saccharomycopsis crataegensis]
MNVLNKPSAKPVVIIVAALVPSLGIGNKGTMPWRLRREMKYFREVTSGNNDGSSNTNAVIMGRKTWESIPEKFRPLPGRRNMVLSRSYPDGDVQHTKNPHHHQATTTTATTTTLFNSVESAIAYCDQSVDINTIYIIGGAEIYNQAVNNQRVRQILLTEINSDQPVEMDTFLEFKLDNHEWIKQNRQRLREVVGHHVELPQEEILENGFRYNFTLWERK